MRTAVEEHQSILHVLGCYVGVNKHMSFPVC